MNVYILLDRSGSMSTLWKEAIGSINAYVKKLGKKDKVFLSAFDDSSYDVLRETTVGKWTDVLETELTPRGMTPLYDSCGKILDKAQSDNAKKTIVVVMTDGFENCSKEFTQQSIKDKIKLFEDKKWEVIFLGANFDSVEAVSGQIGVSTSKTLNYAAGNMMRGMDMLATSSIAYATMDSYITFSDEVKQDLGTAK